MQRRSGGTGQVVRHRGMGIVHQNRAVQQRRLQAVGAYEIMHCGAQLHVIAAPRDANSGDVVRTEDVRACELPEIAEGLCERHSLGEVVRYRPRQ